MYIDKRPVVGVTIGDPAGIGPEIVLKALLGSDIDSLADIVVIGDKTVLQCIIDLYHLNMEINCIGQPSEGEYKKHVLNLINLENIPDDFAFGKVDPLCGAAAFEYIKRSVDLALSGQIDSIATAPVNKEALNKSGIHYIGQTEIFGALTNVSNPLTMFDTDGLRIFFLSSHMSIKQAIDAISVRAIVSRVKECMPALQKFGCENPALAIAGLNPHSGENGLFGDEELRCIIPAVGILKAEGYNVFGPIPSDAVFHLAYCGKYDAVLSLYHDQGRIAAKTLNFEHTVALTNKLPFLRTSVDHGTAMEIAAKDRASSMNMQAAILKAIEYTPYYNQ
jgi:4-hydroxythreonine-4-phosphate dehydrogenase